MKKRAYEKPTCKASILVGSGDPVRNVPWWDGEGD